MHFFAREFSNVRYIGGMGIECINFENPPKRKGLVCTEAFSLRIDKDLKMDLMALADFGVDVPEWVRACLRETVREQLRILSAQKTMTSHGQTKRAPR
jgi:hypothetical protein